MKKLKKKEILILLFALIIGFALRFYAFDQKSLWMDEVYTFNDSRDDLKGQIKFYKENPTYLQAPFFFILTHQFCPFTKPERDLRIIPLIFGTLSIPMIYLLAKQFSESVAIPCALSLTFMTYHISLSQEGRSYSLAMFLGMASLHFFMKHLTTLKKTYLILAATLSSILFYTSYSSIPFIILSQILWFYPTGEKIEKDRFRSFLIFNGTVLLLCLPWILFIALNYRGQPMMDPYEARASVSFWRILYGVLHDWASNSPLLVVSLFLLALLPILSKDKQKGIILLAGCFLPIGGLYLFCKLLNIGHFITSRYLINFLPFFFISIYLSVLLLELKFEKIRKFVQLRLLLVVLFIASNLFILPLYFYSQKQDIRGLVTYLKSQLREGDKILDAEMGYVPGILHYFGAYPKDRHYDINYRKVSENEVEFRKSFIYQNRLFTIYSSRLCCARYVEDGSRLWIVARKENARRLKNDWALVFKGYFDGSFLNLHRFPEDASIYLFLLDPKSPGEKGIDIPFE